MKLVITVLIGLFLSTAIQAREATVRCFRGPMVKSLTLSYGLSTQPHQPTLNVLDVHYDRLRSNCHRKNPYWGMGASYRFAPIGQAATARAFINPIPRTFQHIDRHNMIIPYLGIEGEFRDVINHQEKPSRYLVRPTIGLSGIFLRTDRLQIRTTLSGGYNLIGAASSSSSDRISALASAGIGWNFIHRPVHHNTK
ncbi:MAG: hypothetical protein H6608_12220 [Flavobacteriales bacterium]|nr:hypothetical protein [Bacteroidota bacterium]MCB9241896.1 hypothetical protein [Flavobacteriales bacterium]